MTETSAKVAATEVKKTIRNFKSSSDVENFYRFVAENRFRREAHLMLKVVHKMMAAKNKPKRKPRKKQVH